MEETTSPYQKEITYNKLLPYSDCFEEEANAVLAEIKLNLGRAIALRELRPGGLHWCNRLFRFVFRPAHSPCLSYFLLIERITRSIHV